MASAKILKFLKRKTDSGTYGEDIYLGAEQKFVSALRGTHNNNLEEQSILGMDCIITSKWDERTYIEIREFRTEDVLTGYYILESKVLNTAADSSFRGSEVFFTTDLINFVGDALLIQSDEAVFDSIRQSVIIPQNLGNNTSIISEDDNLTEDGFKMTRIDTLFFQGSNGKVEISQKTTYEKKTDDITVTKSVITNKL